MNLLYVGERIEKVTSGGDLVNKNNQKILSCICGDDFLIEDVHNTSKISTFVNLVLGLLCGLTPIKIKQILSRIGKEGIDRVFLPSSKMGIIAKQIKERYPNVSVICFYHNIEYQYCEEELRLTNNWKNRLISKVVRQNEKYATQYSDRVIVLNQRDAELMKTIYRRTPDLILPVCMDDVYKRVKNKCTKTNDLILLFVGTAFFANVEGVKWFVDIVMPLLSGVHFFIVGKGMDRYFANQSHITVKGFVDDLGAYYYSCDMVVLPIFSGGGMKTKTAESMMYGCPIIGTKEAFEGYDVDYNKIGACCSDVDDFVKAIEEARLMPESLVRKGEYARKEFLRNHSLESGIQKVKSLLV